MAGQCLPCSVINSELLLLFCKNGFQQQRGKSQTFHASKSVKEREQRPALKISSQIVKNDNNDLPANVFHAWLSSQTQPVVVLAFVVLQKSIPVTLTNYTTTKAFLLRVKYDVLSGCESTVGCVQFHIGRGW